MDVVEIRKKLREGGVLGAGGAGFPTYAKLSDSRINTIILNCAECEPLLCVDKLLLAKYTREIFSAASTISEALACDVIVAVKKAYEDAVLACLEIISDFSGFHIKELPDLYPTGDEVALIYECTGKTVPEGSLPLSLGIVVFNIETMLNVYGALNAEPVIYKYVTVAGEVHTPKTVKIPVGVTFGEVIAIAGGEKRSGVSIISGGPMTGKLAQKNSVVTKTTKGILVLPDNNFVVKSKSAKISTEIRNAMSVCSQCRMCTDLCPRFLLGHAIEPHKFMRTVHLKPEDILSERFLDSFNCCECGICEMFACHQNLSPRRIITEYKNNLRAKGVRPRIPKSDYKTNEMFKYRRLSEKRLIMRLGLSEYSQPSEIEDYSSCFSDLTLNLSQSIGMPPVPTVKNGDTVKKGGIVAEAVSDKLSISLSSPIDGVVSEVTGTFIKIKGGGV